MDFSGKTPRRPYLARFEKLVVAEMEQNEDRLAKEVLQATYKQIEAHVDHDLALLVKKFGVSQEEQAAEASKDAKFLRDRQLCLASCFGFRLFPLRKGATWVKNWMASRCVLVEVNDTMAGAMNEFSTFNAQFHGSAGRRYLGDRALSDLRGLEEASLRKRLV